MSDTLRTLWRIILVATLFTLSFATLGADLDVVRARGSSTWYWQNPVPRAYSIRAIACPSTTHCVAVGLSGSITTTSDGARHWTARNSGTPLDLWGISCPTQTVCYTVGSVLLPAIRNIVLKSVDGGMTWSPPSARLPLALNGVLENIICASRLVCFLITGVVESNTTFIQRTADGGRTWHAISGFGANEGGPVCPTSTVCYAWRGSTLVRSKDAGATWKRWSQVPAKAGSLGTLVCPRPGTCLAGAISSGPNQHENILVTRDDGTTWQHVAQGSPGQLACGSATRCYQVGFSTILQTSDGGATWSPRPFSFPEYLLQVVCPGPTTCYAAAGYTALKTADGFLHVEQTPAKSVVPSNMLGVISCPSVTTCYASSQYNASSAIVVTRDGGRTWTSIPGTPRDNVICPTTTVCYSFGSPNAPPTQGSNPSRSTDGARSWQTITMSTSQVNGSICFNASACDVLAGGPSGYSLLITKDGGTTWNTKTSVGKAINSSALDAPLSCPNPSTCFVLTGRSQGISAATLRLWGTKDGGNSWHASAPITCTNRCGGNVLDCPTVTTCYIVPVGFTSATPYPVIIVVTHDAGVTWHKAGVTPAISQFLTAVACADAQHCRAVGTAGIYATQDGGKTWQKQVVAGESHFLPDLFGISCPSIDRCYAVGGEAILATHP